MFKVWLCGKKVCCACFFLCATIFGGYRNVDYCQSCAPLPVCDGIDWELSPRRDTGRNQLKPTSVRVCLLNNVYVKESLALFMDLEF